MIALIIGISTGIVLILALSIFKRIEKPVFYGLILAGIGFLYIGFTWTNTESLVINSVQASVFVFLAFYGITKNRYVLAIGYFMHGTWDLAYDFLHQPDLLPPHYDLFCLAVDFTIGIYLLIFTRASRPSSESGAV